MHKSTKRRTVIVYIYLSFHFKFVIHRIVFRSKRELELTIFKCAQNKLNLILCICYFNRNFLEINWIMSDCFLLKANCSKIKHFRCIFIYPWKIMISSPTKLDKWRIKLLVNFCCHNEVNIIGYPFNISLHWNNYEKIVSMIVG